MGFGLSGAQGGAASGWMGSVRHAQVGKLSSGEGGGLLSITLPGGWCYGISGWRLTPAQILDGAGARGCAVGSARLPTGLWNDYRVLLRGLRRPRSTLSSLWWTRGGRRRVVGLIVVQLFLKIVGLRCTLLFMQTLLSADLRKNLFKVLDRVASMDEPVEILKHGKPIAIIGPSPGVSPQNRKPSIDLDAISRFCKQHQIANFSLFGSILRDDFDKTSDVDVLVDTKGRRLTFKEECRMLDSLETMFGRKVDMLTTLTLESPTMNPYLKTSISTTARLIHHEGT